MKNNNSETLDKELKLSMELLSYKYKKCYSALEEIEKISHYGTFKCVDCAGFNCRACTKEQFEIILDIINKVKEQL